MNEQAVSTSGVQLRSGARWVRDAVELLSSMRFAIALLTVIAIASVVGTVVVQHQPAVNYVNQFGPFWAAVFDTGRLYAIYGAWWFLLILAFLVLSTSLCIVRQTPKIMADLRTYKEHVRAQSLKAFHHKAQGTLGESRQEAFDRISAWLVSHGWKARAQQRDGAEGGIMVAARKGSANKIGYLSAHSAIVLICIGGLFDGDLMVRAQLWMQGKSAYTGGGLISEVPAQHRLGVGNPTYRGNLFVSEGATAGAAVLNMANGVVIQDLPFAVELKRFIVEYYDTGMPRLFASEILVHDPALADPLPFRVEVNKPAIHRGVAIYQSSFDDGGSRVQLTAHPLGLSGAAGKPFQIDTTVGATTNLTNRVDQLQLELVALRTINVENFTGADPASSTTDVRRVDLVSAVESRLGSGAKTVTQRQLRNVGPSVTYKLRDASGQAHEFHHYMLPVELDGQRVFLAGVRDDPNDAFRYMRIPADENDALDGWLGLERALHDPALRGQAVQRYAAQAVADDRPDLREQLRASATRALALFAGAEAATDPNGSRRVGGLQAVADFMERSVPPDDRQRTSDVLVRILNGVLFELVQVARAEKGLAPLEADEQAQAFLTQSVLALSDSFFYPVPVFLHLEDFEHVQASVFQVARAPGQNLVYLGCTLLIIGVFAMLYVRERRLWVWLEATPQGTNATMALSSTRQTLELDREFEHLRRTVFKENS